MSRNLHESAAGDPDPSLPVGGGDACIAGGGEAGAIMRALDWSKNPLGPVAGWPPTLKILVRVMLASRFAMRILWGPEFIFLYNDGYRPILGATKHPGAMGSRTAESFHEVWDIVGPMFRRVYQGESVALDDTLLSLDRNGYTEECYFTLSYSPIVEDDGRIGGVLGVVHETTERLVAERRLRTLRDLAGRASVARSTAQACSAATQTLVQNGADVPFALVYMLDAHGDTATLVSCAGISGDTEASPATITLTPVEPSVEPAWPLASAASGRFTVAGVRERFGELRAGPFPEPVENAAILALTRPGLLHPYGFLVAGVSPRRALDDRYQAFFELASEHIVTAVSNVVAAEQERVRADARANLESERRAAAEAERQRLYSLFMQTPVAICLLRGADHVFELANAPYRRLVGGRDVVGKRLRDVLPEVVDSIGAILDRVFTGGERFVGNEIAIPVARGGTVEDAFFNFIYEPLLDADGLVEGIAVVVFEVTDQVQGRSRAELLSQELAASNQDLDQFAYVASHDLKAPLRGIANLSEWIEEAMADKMTAETRSHMQMLRGRVHRLEALIDGVLHYARAGRTREPLAPVDSRALLVEARELLAPAPPATVVFTGEFPTVRAERVPLQQVFLNLMGNALKHARRPDVHVAVSCVDAGEFHDFQVKDDGPGIAPQFHERIWGIFTTLQARDEVEGTGIGLSVVKKIVEKRGGKVAVDSEPGAGATFHAYWPKQPKELA